MTATQTSITQTRLVGDRVQIYRRGAETPERISSTYRTHNDVARIDPADRVGKLATLSTTSSQSSFLTCASVGGATR